MENTANDSTRPKRMPDPRPFRFSILALLGLMAVCALIVALFAMMGERAKWKAQSAVLREELRQLREAHQLLNVEDPSKISVRRMIAPFKRMGQWQVHLPEGGEYRLKYDWKDLPPDRDPHIVYRPFVGMKLLPGTYTISQTFLFEPSRNKSEWVAYITATKPRYDGVIGYGFPRDAPSWLTSYKVSDNKFELPSMSEGKSPQEFSLRTSGLWANAPQSEFDTDEKVTLITYEVYDPGSPSQSPGGLLPQEVFRLWIEKEPQQP